MLGSEFALSWCSSEHPAAFNARKNLYLCNKMGKVYLFRTIILSKSKLLMIQHMAGTEVIRYTTGN